MQQPSTTLRPGSHKSLIEQVLAGPSLARMQQAEQRRQVLEGDWRPHVWALMRRYAYSDEVFAKVAQRVKRSSNVANRVIGKVALAYKVPPMRTIAGASEATQTAFREVVLEESGFAVQTQRWERLVWGMNVVITVPMVHVEPGRPSGRRLEYAVLTGANTEVVTAEDSPTAIPRASVTMVVERGELQPSKIVILDDQAWTTYTAEGKLQGRVEHGAGVWPGTPWRRIESADWWARYEGAGLFEATLEVAHILARLDWIRQGQDHKREVLFTEEMGRVARQVAGSDAFVDIEIGPEDARYQVEDASVPVGEHNKHAIGHARDGASSIGVDPDLLDFKEGAEGIEPIVAAQKHDELKTLRMGSIEHFRMSERDSAWKTALVLRAARHPSAPLLQPSVIMDGYKANWSDLEFVDHPETRLRVIEAQIDLGLKSKVDAFMAEHRVGREAAAKEVMRVAEEEAMHADFLSERNTPRLLRDRTSNIAELQGRIGGITGGERRNPDDDDPSDGNAERRNRSSRRARGRGPGANTRARSSTRR